MSNKIGRFEILSEITHSEIGSVYKATDPESGQTVTLKTIQLELLGEQAAAITHSIQEEAEAAKVLNSHNIVQLFGASELEGQFCACLEYVQGNSVATMLARKEGFSIWDLQDIARQTCQGLDHAHSKGVFHYSLEPAKIMVTWDGTVKILGFGISAMGAYASQAAGKAPDVLHYMSPEQLRGDPLDACSNLFSLGAIFYEMVTERKAFDGDDSDQVRQSILEMTPVAPDQINRKLHPALSEVIMKVLSKAPEERYHAGQELVNDLERCKESTTKVAAKKAAQPAQGLNVPQKQALAPKAVAEEKSSTQPAMARTPEPTKPAVQVPRKEVAPPPASVPDRKTPAPAAKAAAAAAGWPGMGSRSASVSKAPNPDAPGHAPDSPVNAAIEAVVQEEASMSAAAAPAIEAPSGAFDPTMAESEAAGKHGPSFSEIEELPPLKEIYVAPPPPPEPEPAPKPQPALFMAHAKPEKPKVQPREVARKAVKEIKKTPPKLFMYSIAAAVGIILLVVVGIAFRIHSENAEDEGTPVQLASTPAQADAGATPAPNSASAPGQAPAAVEAATAEPGTDEPAVSVQPRYKNKRKATPTTPSAVVIPGQMTVNSTPEGAQVRIDGRSDPSWVTPINMTGLSPGQHTISVSKPGFSSETRNIDVASGSKSFVVIQLAQMAAVMAVTSDPAGAAVFVDGKDTGRVTPTQISVDKPGAHTVLVRKQGYLDETTTVNLQVGQTSRFAPSLRMLGATDEIKTAGRFKKMFGGGGAAEMGTVSIKTQPKGAQIAVNRRILDKNSPVEFYLNPGNYMIDITLSGYKTVHRVVNVDKGNKLTLEETLQRE